VYVVCIIISIKKKKKKITDLKYIFQCIILYCIILYCTNTFDSFQILHSKNIDAEIIIEVPNRYR